jgi:hypothetical protein
MLVALLEWLAWFPSNARLGKKFSGLFLDVAPRRCRGDRSNDVVASIRDDGGLLLSPKSLSLIDEASESSFDERPRSSFPSLSSPVGSLRIADLVGCKDGGASQDPSACAIGEDRFGEDFLSLCSKSDTLPNPDDLEVFTRLGPLHGESDRAIIMPLRQRGKK